MILEVPPSLGHSTVLSVFFFPVNLEAQDIKRC